MRFGLHSCKRRAGALLLAVLPLPTPTHPSLVPPPCAIAIDLGAESPRTLDERAQHVISSEVDRIWGPYGVKICWTRASAPCDEWTVRLHVLLVDGESAPAAAQGKPILGSLTFDGSGPGTDVTLSVKIARSLVSRASVDGAMLENWPGTSVDAFVPRVLGRALAHEIGHFVLRSRQHARAGLMSAGFGPDQVTFGTTSRFHLTEPEALAVRQQCLARDTSVLGG